MESLKSKNTLETIGLLFVVAFISFSTYVRNYEHPPMLTWDENYYVASAQKYLNGTYFAEVYPPLGPLLMAAGERLLDKNQRDDHFLNVLSAGDLQTKPEDLSLAGYRFFPVVMGWLTAPLVFLIMLLITKDRYVSLFLSCLYVFDNALVVRNRAAMLEGPLLFFMALHILSFLVLREWNYRRDVFYTVTVLHGLSAGCIAVTKIYGLIILISYPLLFLQLTPLSRRSLSFLLVSSGAAVFIAIFVWHLHFSLAHTINPLLPGNGFFHSVGEPQQILAEGKGAKLSLLPTLLIDLIFNHWPKNHEGMPLLNLCDPMQASSPWFLWPVGGRAINYLSALSDGLRVKYLYLQGNPLVWFTSLTGLIVAMVVVFARTLFGRPIRIKQPLLLGFFLGSYVIYMGFFTQLVRTTFLHHYLVPLFLSFFVVAVVFTELSEFLGIPLSEERKRKIAFVWVIGVLVTFKIYSPLTYFESISDLSLSRRALLGVWDLNCRGCPRTNGFAAVNVESLPERFRIGDIAASNVINGRAVGRIGLTTRGQPIKVGGNLYEISFGVAVDSSLTFPLEKRFEKFSVSVAVPDTDTPFSGPTFQIIGDEKILWESGPMSNHVLSTAEVDVRGIKELRLKLQGDINAGGSWINPNLIPMRW